MPLLQKDTRTSQRCMKGTPTLQTLYENYLLASAIGTLAVGSFGGPGKNCATTTDIVSTAQAELHSLVVVPMETYKVGTAVVQQVVCCSSSKNFQVSTDFGHTLKRLPGDYHFLFI